MKEVKRRLAENKAAFKGRPLPTAADETKPPTLDDELKERQIDHKLWKVLYFDPPYTRSYCYYC